MADIIDIQPFIRRKQDRECQHHQVDVSMTVAELTCRSCGAEIDPWWYLRWLAKHDEDWELHLASQQKAVDDVIADGQAMVARLNDEIQRKNDEIKALYNAKTRFANEEVNGRKLSAQVARRDKRA